MKLSVVIVNYNVKHYLWQCVHAVMSATKGMDADVWVVDNASTDGSETYLTSSFPQLHWVGNTENVGFARANNQAIRLSAAQYVLLLNPDTIVGEEVLRQAVAFMDAHPEAGGLGVQMLNRDGSFARESRRGVPTPLTAFYKMTGLSTLFPKSPRFGRYYMQYLDVNEAAQIEIISGAFCMLRREALDQVGLLDEDYFMYGEDIDLSYRLLQGGWQNWYAPLNILHYKGESTQKTSFRYVQNFYNVMLIFFNKHLAHRYWGLKHLIRLTVQTCKVIGLSQRAWFKTMHRLFGRPHLEEPPCKLLYIGSEEGFEALRPLCQRAGKEVSYCGNQAEALLSAPASAHKTVTYATFEAEAIPYSTMLATLKATHAAGKDFKIATFSQTTQTLILPDGIFQ